MCVLGGGGKNMRERIQEICRDTMERRTVQEELFKETRTYDWVYSKSILLLTGIGNVINASPTVRK